jgi:hypothetical protein
MSHTQNKRNCSDFPRTEIFGSGYSVAASATPAIDEVDIRTAEQLVQSKQIEGNLQSLVQYLIERGLGAKGLLGCLLVPFADKKFEFRGTQIHAYKRTVAVWVVSHSKGRKDFLSTSNFVAWAEKVSTPSYQGSASYLRSNSIVPVRSSKQGSSSQRSVPLSAGGSKGVPLSTASTRVRGAQTVTPFDSVSQLGDISNKFEDPLGLAEADFRSTPRVKNEKGQSTFDEEEYFTRLDSLNRERRKYGLHTVEAATPSTYQR